MFRVPDGIDPKLRRTLQDIQGILYKLSRQVQQRTGSSEVYYQFMEQGGAQPASGAAEEVREDYSGDWTVHGNLFVDGTIYGTGKSTIDPTATDVTSSRAIGTVYHNTASTMIRVDVSAEFT